MPLAGNRIPKTLEVATGLAGSGEGLLETVADRGSIRGRSLLIYEEELAVVLRKMRQEGSTLAGFLIQAADAQPILTLRTRKRPLVATSPTIALLSASTSEWLEADTQESDIRGGLVNRILWFYGADKQAVPLPPASAEGPLKAAQDALRAWIPHLPAVRSTAGRFTAEATALYGEWYKAWHAKDHLSSLAAAAVGRTHAHAVRLALLYSLLDRQDGVILTPHVEAAIAVAEYCAGVAEHLFLTASQHVDARADRSILTYLAKRRIGERPVAVPLRDIHARAVPNLPAYAFLRLMSGLAGTGYLKMDMANSTAYEVQTRTRTTS